MNKHLADALEKRGRTWGDQNPERIKAMREEQYAPDPPFLIGTGAYVSARRYNTEGGRRVGVILAGCWVEL